MIFSISYGQLTFLDEPFPEFGSIFSLPAFITLLAFLWQLVSFCPGISFSSHGWVRLRWHSPPFRCFVHRYYCAFTRNPPEKVSKLPNISNTNAIANRAMVSGLCNNTGLLNVDYHMISDMDSFTMDMEEANLSGDNSADGVHFSKILSLMPNYNKESFESDKSSQPLLDDERISRQLTSLV